MNLKKLFNIILLGLMIWAMPFFIGFLFYNQTGTLSINVFLFKSIMIVSLSLITMISINLLFKNSNKQFLKSALYASIIWLSIVLLLDHIILIPIAEMSTSQYIYQIGLRYLIIPIITIFTGLILRKHTNSKHVKSN